MDDLETRYKSYLARRDVVVQNKLKIEAALSERKKNLKEAIDECKSLGYNPDTLAEDIKKLREVLVTKLSVCESDLQEVEVQLSPMLKEIE